MSWGFRVLVLTFCVAVIGRSYGAQPIITKSSISNLLQQPTVSSVYRDRAGILWIGTQQGLHRFDGANLTVFNSDRSNQNWIPESEIKDIAEDNDGNLLVGTSGGILLKWNKQIQSFESLVHGGNFDQTRLIRLLVSKLGSIWLLSKDELILIDPKFGNYVEGVENSNLTKNIGKFHDIVEDESGNLWVGGSLGLAKIVPQSGFIESFTLETIQLSKNSILTALEMSSEGNLVIGTDTGQLAVWDIKASRSLANAMIGGDTASYISDFVLYGDMLIIATDRGVFASDKYFSRIQDLGDKGDGLSNPDVHSLFQDEKSIWIGTIDGLYLLSFTPFDLFNSKNSRVSNDILAFEEDDDDNIWIGTYSGLYRYNENTKDHSRFDLTFSTTDNQRISTIAARGNELWLGFLRGGVQIVNTHDGRSQSHILTDIENANSTAITKILASERNSDILIATYDRGLFRITGDITISLYENSALYEKTITLLFQSTSGLLAVSENRIYRYNSQSDHFEMLNLDFRLGERSPIIYDIAQLNNGDILIGTKDHGLFTWLDENQSKSVGLLQPVNESDLTTSTIYGIELDLQRNLWCSTQNGIVKLDSNGRLIKRFTTADGLQGNDFSLGASFTSRKGLIYFGGVNGYNRFDPNEVSIDTSSSPMRLTNIKLPRLDERIMGDVNQLESLQLTHSDYFVTFQFSVLDFIFPERNQYRYKLENFDPDWIENGTSNTATYTNLPAGNYVLRVQGANSAGIWNREGISLAVRVVPPPWLKAWAYSIYGIVFIFLVWVAHRIYQSYAIDRTSTQLATQMFEAANRADDDMQEQLELQDELIHSSFQHTRTTLGLVSDYISHRSGGQAENEIRELTDSSVKRIAALSILEDSLYYEAGESVANLHKYTEDIIPALLQRSPVRPETIITINEITSALLPAQLATPLSMVIYELLENCVQHAFKLSSPANYIHLKLILNTTNDSGARNFELSVRDSGIGLPDSIENLALESSGISIVLSIVTKLGGTLQCVDASGTAISITFPNRGESN